jgi:hypothetical protein
MLKKFNIFACLPSPVGHVGGPLRHVGAIALSSAAGRYRGSASSRDRPQTSSMVGGTGRNHGGGGQGSGVRHGCGDALESTLRMGWRLRPKVSGGRRECVRLGLVCC